MNQELFERAQDGDIEARNEIAQQMFDFMKTEVETFAARRRIDPGEVLGSAFVGLTQAIERFDTQRGNRFATYARHRIQGAMADQSREDSWVSLKVARRAKALDRAEFTLFQALGYWPDRRDMEASIGARELDLGERARRFKRRVSIDALEIHPAACDERDDADTRAEEFAAKALALLSGRDHRIFKAVYVEGASMRVAGEREGISESMASAVLRRCRSQVTKAMGGKPLERRPGIKSRDWVPFGYQCRNRKVSLAPRDAEVVRLIFDLYLLPRGSTASVARFLQRDGIEPNSQGFVFKALKNTAYVGRPQREKKLKGLRFPRIISDGQFEAAQRKIERLSSKRRRAVAR